MLRNLQLLEDLPRQRSDLLSLHQPCLDLGMDLQLPTKATTTTRSSIPLLPNGRAWIVWYSNHWDLRQTRRIPAVQEHQEPRVATASRIKIFNLLSVQARPTKYGPLLTPLTGFLPSFTSLYQPKVPSLEEQKSLYWEVAFIRAWRLFLEILLQPPLHSGVTSVLTA